LALEQHIGVKGWVRYLVMGVGSARHHLKLANVVEKLFVECVTVMHHWIRQDTRVADWILMPASHHVEASLPASDASIALALAIGLARVSVGGWAIVSFG
jgi:hypothetical protein